MTGQPIRCLWIQREDRAAAPAELADRDIHPSTPNAQYADGLGWLQGRVQHFSAGGRGVHLIRLDVSDVPRQLSPWLEQGIDRILVACPDRLSYPGRADLQWLQRHCGDIPVAVATDNWWDGARRTGLGLGPFLIQPWYRWWDCWADWLYGRTGPGLFDPAPLSLARCLPEWPSAAAAGQLPPGIVVSRCQQMAQTWLLAARAAGATADAMSPEDCFNRLEELPEVGVPVVGSLSPDSVPAWLLWDDSCLDSWRGPSSEEAAVDFFELVQRRLPAVLSIAAVSLPRLDLWQRMAGHGSAELLVKPTLSRALRRVLGARLPGCDLVR